MAVATDKERGLQSRGVPSAPAWATEPPVWGEPISFEHLRKQLEEMDRKRVYRFAYPDGSKYETSWRSESAAKAWASQHGHRYLGEVEVKRPVERTPRDIGSRGTEPPLSPPPLVQAQPRKPQVPPARKKTPRPKQAPATPPVPDTLPKRDDDTIWELREVKRKINQLRPELDKTRHKAQSKSLHVIPGIGFLASAVYDFFIADEPGSAAEGLAREGVEESAKELVEHALKKELPPGWKGPLEAWEMHEAMLEHGENVEKMDVLIKRRYRLMDKLGMPDARYDLRGTNYYLGPEGLLYEKSTQRPAPRF